MSRVDVTDTLAAMPKERPMKHVVNFSFGESSWATGKLVVERYGAENTVLLFADTLIEDEDTYAWGKAAAENIGAPLVRVKVATRGMARPPCCCGKHFG